MKSRLLLALAFIVMVAGLAVEVITISSQIKKLEDQTFVLQSKIGNMQTQLLKMERNLTLSPYISLTPDTLASQSVKAGQENVVFARFKITAGSKDLRVSMIAIKQYGTSTYRELGDLKLYVGSTQLDLTQSLDPRSNRVVFYNVNLLIPAHTATTITVSGSISEQATVNRTVQLGIDSQGSIGANSTMDGRFPIKGNVFTLDGNR